MVGAVIELLFCEAVVLGEVLACDFNQMLKMQWRDHDRALSLWDIDPAAVEHREIQTGEHCFGCTAGAGSSCGGALL